MPIKVSIIVPVYNAEKFIDKCMSSIYAQELKDYEIILVNDGSRDGSAKICKAYAEQDDRIIFIDKENGGAGSARNAGIECASGEYLAFPDVDDWFEPQMYKELYELAVQGDFDMVFSGVNYYSDKTGQPVFIQSLNCEEEQFCCKKDCRENVMKFFPTSTIFDVPWNKLYKRQTAIDRNVRFSDHKRCQDAMFNLDFYNASERVASLSKSYYNYIVNDQDRVRRKFPQNYIDINIAYYTHLKSILSDWGKYEGEIKKHYDTSFVIAVFETATMYDNPVWCLNKAGQTEYVERIFAKSEVQAYISGAYIREDAYLKYKIIKEKNVKLFFKTVKKEKRKERLRQNRFLMSIYRFLRGEK